MGIVQGTVMYKDKCGYLSLNLDEREKNIPVSCYFLRELIISAARRQETKITDGCSSLLKTNKRQ